MASYEELFDLARETALRDKVVVALSVAAETIYAEDPATDNHANRVIWAREAIQKPFGMLDVFLPLVLADNKALDAVSILNASDAAIQASVDANIDNVADGTPVVP